MSHWRMTHVEKPLLRNKKNDLDLKDKFSIDVKWVALEQICHAFQHSWKNMMVFLDSLVLNNLLNM